MCSVRVYKSFSAWVETWNKPLRGLPCLLPFCIAEFHFKHNYILYVIKHILLNFAPIMPAFLLCFHLPIIPILLPAKLTHPYYRKAYKSPEYHFKHPTWWNSSLFMFKSLLGLSDDKLCSKMYILSPKSLTCYALMLPIMFVCIIYSIMCHINIEYVYKT